MKYAPQSEVLILEDPRKQPYAAFRIKGKSGTSVFVLLPGDLVVICAEFKGGLEEISLLPPGGQLKPGENPEDCGKREFENETGICLDRVICLNKADTGLNFRQMYLLDYPCLGIPTDPLIIKPLKRGKREFIQIVLIPLKDWLCLIEESNVVMEMHSVEVTYMALRKLGRLTLK